MLDGEPVRVSIVNGIARILVCGSDIHVPGKFDGDPKKVLSVYKMQIEEIDAAFANLPDDWQPPSSMLPEGWEPIAGLDYVEMELHKNEVIYLEEVRRHD